MLIGDKQCMQDYSRAREKWDWEGKRDRKAGGNPD